MKIMQVDKDEFTQMLENFYYDKKCENCSYKKSQCCSGGTLEQCKSFLITMITIEAPVTEFACHECRQFFKMEELTKIKNEYFCKKCAGRDVSGIFRFL